MGHKRTLDKSIVLLCWVESIVLVLIAAFFIGRAILWSLSGGATLYYTITQYPDKLTYVIGKDTELDFTGGKINISYDPLTPSGPDYDMETSVGTIWEDISNIDFTKEGIYLVILESGGDRCSFPIQVISPDYVE